MEKSRKQQHGPETLGFNLFKHIFFMRNIFIVITSFSMLLIITNWPLMLSYQGYENFYVFYRS